MNGNAQWPLAGRVMADGAEPAAGDSAQPHRFFTLGLAAVLLAGLLAIAPTLLMGLHADDWFQIRPRGTAEILSTFAGDWGEGRRGEGGFYRPMVRVIFAVDRALHGERAWGYHLTNGLIFLALIAAVYQTARLLSEGNEFPAAVFVVAGIVFNPVKNEALYWASGRTDLLAALFVMWTVYAALVTILQASHGRDARAPLLVSLLCLVLGLLSKEIALAGCAIVPTAVWLLRPAGRVRRAERVLLSVPPVLGCGYLLMRGVVLGGLAGYESEPRTVGVFIESFASCLSALFWPWQADGPQDYTNFLALPGLAFCVIALALTRCRRGPVVALAGMVLSLVPATFIDITPNDGARVLMLPLCFQVLFVAALFRKGMASSLPAMAVAALWGLLLQRDNVAITVQFLEARPRNVQVVGYAWGVLDRATAGAVVVTPEPPRTHRRRVLDPGAALIMAMQTRWLERDGAASEDLADVEVPRFALLLREPGREVVLAHALQPWMEGPVRHVLHGDQTTSLTLQRIGFEEAATDEAESLLTLTPGLGEVIAWSILTAQPVTTSPHLRIERHDGTLVTTPGFYFSSGGKGVAWMDTVAWQKEEPAAVTLVPAEPQARRFQLQKIQKARYMTGTDKTE